MHGSTEQVSTAEEVGGATTTEGDAAVTSVTCEMAGTDVDFR